MTLDAPGMKRSMNESFAQFGSPRRAAITSSTWHHSTTRCSGLDPFSAPRPLGPSATDRRPDSTGNSAYAGRRGAVGSQRQEHGAIGRRPAGATKAGLRIYMYIYVYTYIHVYIYIYMYTYIYVYTSHRPHRFVRRAVGERDELVNLEHVRVQRQNARLLKTCAREGWTAANKQTCAVATWGATLQKMQHVDEIGVWMGERGGGRAEGVRGWGKALF